MRRIVIFCVLALAVAGPAGAQSKKTRIVTPPAQALRGPVTATPPQPAASVPPPAVAIDPRGPILPAVSTPVGGQAQQCRLSCAQTYYFCLSEGRPEDCSGNWGQCRAACSASASAGY